ncbi:MAG TPA: ferritin-like domain-containing protein [Acidimicrobiales bacterium]|nr:ferritin-like domain-containing protein [Acidimicrobiales bacterium]
MPDDDKMKIPQVLEKLDAALALQYRSALELTVLAGSQVGIERQPLAGLLWSFAQEELADARRLVEKIVTLGGNVSTAAAAFDPPTDPDAALSALVEHELEALEAIHAVIPDTGQEARSEALEHRVEHMIMRKQEQVDTLRRMLGRTGG